MQWLNKISLAIASLAVLLMCLIGGVDVVTAFAFSWPIPAAYEVTELLMAVVVFLAIAPLQARRMNISIEVFYERMRPATQRCVTLLSNVIGTFFFGLIAWQTWLMATESLLVGEYTQGGYPIPVYPAKLILACGATLVVLQYVKDTWLVVVSGRTRSSPTDVRDTKFT